MGTNAQNEANRRNAKKSTGPRSQAGKAVASQNALKHGLTADRVIIPGEDPSELEEFRRQVESHFEPVGWRETNIVDRIIMQMWRLRRVPEIEAGIFSFQLAKIELENTRREADENDFLSNLLKSRDPDERECERKAQRSLDEASKSPGALLSCVIHPYSGRPNEPGHGILPQASGPAATPYKHRAVVRPLA